MKHFVTEEWVDFVNNQLSAQQMEPMQRHLETGCQRCSKLFEIWNLVSQAARRDSELDVPESAVRHVRNAFAILAEPKSTARALEIPAHTAPNLEAALALARALTPANGLIIATGSTYLVGEIRRLVVQE